MDDKTAFHPEPGQCMLVVAAVGTAANALPGTFLGPSRAVRLVNKGAVDVYFDFGPSTITAVAPIVGTPGSHVLPAGQTEIFQPGGATHIAMLSASATANVFVSMGVGL